MIHGSQRNRTSITGTLLLQKIKQKLLDWTNGRVLVLYHNQSKKYAGYILGCSLVTRPVQNFLSWNKLREIFFYGPRDELCYASMHCAWDMGKKRFFCFQDVTRDFDPVIRYDLEVLCWKVQEAFSIPLGRRGIACWWAAVYWECQSCT